MTRAELLATLADVEKNMMHGHGWARTRATNALLAFINDDDVAEAFVRAVKGNNQ